MKPAYAMIVVLVIVIFCWFDGPARDGRYQLQWPYLTDTRTGFTWIASKDGQWNPYMSHQKPASYEP